MYGKIFQSVYYGSLAESRAAREVFIFLCVMRDEKGWVDMTFNAACRVVQLTPREALEAWRVLTGTDPDSESLVEGGQRIKARSRTSRGILVVNWKKYRDMRNSVDRAAYQHEKYLERAAAPQPGSTTVNQAQPGSTHTETETETKDKDTVTAARPPRVTFLKPTLQAVQAYCLERRNAVDPRLWMDHYESNGWRVGKNPMKDWKAAVRTWERSGIDRGNGRATAPAPASGDYTALQKARRDRQEWEREQRKGGN